MSAKPIRLMIIDDSLFFREFMSRSLSTDFSVEVVGALSDAQEALQAIPQWNPNIITLDIDTKNIQFKEYIRKLRHDFPHIQVVIVSSPGSSVFEALKAGATDFVSKPNVQPPDNADFIKEVLTKIKTVFSGTFPNRLYQPAAKFTTAPHSPHPASASASQAKIERQAVPPASARPSVASSWKFVNPQKRIVAIGASTGGTEAIVAVVRDLPSDTPGIVIVQHMPPVFTTMYAERLNKLCKMSCREAQNGDRVERGLILVAQGNRQMRLAKDSRGYFVRVEEGEKISGHCPSVDALFESVAAVAKDAAVGVILTGMGSDGAKNLLKMRDAGAYTIGQDEATCVVYGMPMVAHTLGAVTEQLPLDAISGTILRQLCK